jgi:hypothetical protein
MDEILKQSGEQETAAAETVSYCCAHEEGCAVHQPPYNGDVVLCTCGGDTRRLWRHPREPLSENQLLKLSSRPSAAAAARRGRRKRLEGR